MKNTKYFNSKNNKNMKNKAKENTDKSQNVIITYSALEQSRNKITSIGRCLFLVLGIFPFAPICMNLFSRYIMHISSNIYSAALVIFILLELTVMGIYIYKLVLAIMTVYLINENAEIYSLRISTFWYKIKGKMYLIKPMGTRMGRLSMLMYMVGNIKMVLDSVADEVTYEEFITMGRMKRISDISNVKEDKKYIRFFANVKTHKGIQKKNIKIPKIYEKIDVVKVFLKTLEDGNIENAKKVDFHEKKNINEIIMPTKTKREKLINTTLNWTFVMAWLTALTGLYKNVFIIWFSVEFIYVVAMVTDIIIEKIK